MCPALRTAIHLPGLDSMSSRISLPAAIFRWGRAWLHGVALTAWWFAIESCVELAWGSPGRGRMSAMTVGVSLVALGFAAAGLPRVGRQIRRRLPGGGSWRGDALDPWWALVIAFAMVVALRGHMLLVARVDAWSAVGGAVAFGAACVLLGGVVTRMVGRLMGEDLARDRLLHAWTRIGFVGGIAFLKLEFHCAELSATPRARAFQLVLVAVAAIAALGALRWAAQSHRRPRRLGPTVHVCLALLFVCGLQGGQHWAADAALRSGPRATRSGPSALLIIVDTLRADRLTHYGYPHPTSPHLAEFADQAVQFERTAAASPWTLAAMASMLTGRDVGHHGAGFNPGDGNLRNPLPAGIPTVAELAADAGIATVGLATNPFLRPLFGLSRGFDTYACPLGESRARMPVELLTSLLGIELAPYTPAEEMVNRALDWIAGREDQQFLMMLHLMDPHTPYRSAPVPWTRPARYGDNEWVPDPALYDGEVVRVDRALGGLFAGLEARGLLDEMIVVVTSDHGEALGDRGRGDWDLGDDAWYRPYDHGQHMYEEMLRVPLLVKPPASVASGGRTIEALFPMVDLAPTLLELMGVDPDLLGGQGGSWASVLEGREEPEERLAFSGSILYGTEAKALADGRYKLIVRQKPDGAKEHMLYDLLTDPGEVDPAAAVAESVQVHLETTLEAISNSGSAGREAGAIELSPTMQQHLRSLGYVN